MKNGRKKETEEEIEDKAQAEEEEDDDDDDCRPVGLSLSRHKTWPRRSSVSKRHRNSNKRNDV